MDGRVADHFGDVNEMILNLESTVKIGQFRLIDCLTHGLKLLFVPIMFSIPIDFGCVYAFSTKSIERGMETADPRE